MRTGIGNLRIRTKLLGLIGILLLGFTGFGVFGRQVLSTVAVNGPVYRSVVQGHELIADVAPPFATLLPSYLIVLQMLDESDRPTLDDLVQRGQQLRELYEARQHFWLSQLPDGALKDLLAVKAHVPAMRFFDARDRDFIPAVLGGNIAQAAVVLHTTLDPAYEEQRAAVDDIVKQGRAINATTEQWAADFVRTRESAFAIIGLVLLLLVSLSGVAIAASISRPVNRAIGVMKRTAEGDLTQRWHVTTTDDIGELARWFNVALDRIDGLVAQVRHTATAVAEAAQQLAGASAHLSSGCQEQASSLEETAASLEEITGTVKQSADNARQVTQLAAGARESAERGGDVVSAAVASIKDIAVSAARIAEIISVVDEIAFQTNLLALNAAVEAARAGEHGRGFAVVATEVRNLAQRSSLAAKEIKGLIHDSSQRVATGSELVNQSGQTLRALVSSVQQVSDLIADIAAAAQEQAAGITQVNTAVTQMDQVVQATAAQTEELSATAQSLASQAVEVETLVNQFRVSAEPPNVCTATDDPGVNSHVSFRAAGGVPMALPPPPSPVWLSAQAHNVRVVRAGNGKPITLHHRTAT
ncbi:MAG: HAMP domain-containing protein [Deltaproteobacteria bacterium]|nr:HAMP domain-containing protein [Deltaproteobacteria bacterium]MBI3388477.1 HAMP domain-containing protein [Deltaproteobacteria bacterium]